MCVCVGWGGGLRGTGGCVSYLISSPVRGSHVPSSKIVYVGVFL